MHSTSRSSAPALSRTALGLLTTVWLLGCATASSVREAPLSEGESRSFNAEYQTVVRAAHGALLKLGLSLEENRAVNDHTWMLVGKNGASLTSWGEYVRFVIEKQRPQGAIVRLYSERAYAGNVTAKDDFRELFDEMDAQLRPPRSE